MVKLHVNCLENTESVEKEEEEIFTLVEEIFTLHPSLATNSQSVTDWLAKLCQREGGLGKATQTMSLLRKQIRAAAKISNAQESITETATPSITQTIDSSINRTDTVLNSRNDVVAPEAPIVAPVAATCTATSTELTPTIAVPLSSATLHSLSSPSPSLLVPLPINSTSTTTTTTTTTTAPSTSSTPLSPTPLSPSPPPAPISSYVVTSLADLRQIESNRLDLFRKRATIAAEVEEKQIEHIMQESLRGSTTNFTTTTTAAAFTAAATTMATTTAVSTTTDDALFGLENIAATPLKAYRPSIFHHAPPPPTPTPEVGFRVPMPSAYPLYPVPQQLEQQKQEQQLVQQQEISYSEFESIDTSNVQQQFEQWNDSDPHDATHYHHHQQQQLSYYGGTSEINFGFESQLSDVMPENSILQDELPSKQENLMAMPPPPPRPPTLPFPATTNTTTNTTTNITTNTTFLPEESLNNSNITTSSSSWIAPESESLNNRTWVQQIVAQQQIEATEEEEQLEERATISTQLFTSKIFTDVELRDTENNTMEEETTSFDCSKDKMSSSELSRTLDDVPAESLQKMARSRDPDAGLVLASRRARVKVRKAKRLASKKEANKKAKKERLEALKREATLRRERAVSQKRIIAQYSNQPNQFHKSHSSTQKKARKNTKNGYKSSSSKNVGKKITSRSEQKQIEEARRRTIKRLREKQEKLRHKEIERQQQATDQANEKWRLRDAKLKVDRQRRMSRQRFVESKRSVLVERSTNHPQIFNKTKSHTKKKKKLTSILKQPKQPKNIQTTIPVQQQQQQQQQQHQFPENTDSFTIPINVDDEYIEEENMADVSAVYEDVEAWVKSVYGGDDENNAGRIEGRNQSRGKGVVQQQSIHFQDDQQQAEEDEAFLDAILQDS